MLIKTDDMVEVIAGADRGVRGKVLRVDRSVGKVVGRGCETVCTNTCNAANAIRRAAACQKKCPSMCPM